MFLLHLHDGKHRQLASPFRGRHHSLFQPSAFQQYHHPSCLFPPDFPLPSSVCSATSKVASFFSPWILRSCVVTLLFLFPFLNSSSRQPLGLTLRVVYILSHPHVSTDHLLSSTARGPSSLPAIPGAALLQYLTTPYFSNLNRAHAHGSSCPRLPSARGFSPRTPVSASN